MEIEGVYDIPSCSGSCGPVFHVWFHNSVLLVWAHIVSSISCLVSCDPVLLVLFRVVTYFCLVMWSSVFVWFHVVQYFLFGFIWSSTSCLVSCGHVFLFSYVVFLFGFMRSNISFLVSCVLVLLVCSRVDQYFFFFLGGGVIWSSISV